VDSRGADYLGDFLVIAFSDITIIRYHDYQISRLSDIRLSDFTNNFLIIADYLGDELPFLLCYKCGTSPANVDVYTGQLTFNL